MIRERERVCVCSWDETEVLPDEVNCLSRRAFLSDACRRVLLVSQTNEFQRTQVHKYAVVSTAL